MKQGASSSTSHSGNVYIGFDKLVLQAPDGDVGAQSKQTEIRAAKRYTICPLLTLKCIPGAPMHFSVHVLSSLNTFAPVTHPSDHCSVH